MVGEQPLLQQCSIDVHTSLWYPGTILKISHHFQKPCWQLQTYRFSSVPMTEVPNLYGHIGRSPLCRFPTSDDLENRSIGEIQNKSSEYWVGDMLSCRADPSSEEILNRSLLVSSFSCWKTWDGGFSLFPWVSPSFQDHKGTSEETIPHPSAELEVYWIFFPATQDQVLTSVVTSMLPYLTLGNGNLETKNKEMYYDSYSNFISC